MQGQYTSSTLVNMRRVQHYSTSNSKTLDEVQQKTAKFIKENIKINGSATNAFGEIEFAGSITRTAKYVRVPRDLDVKILRQLLVDYWNLEVPNLIISVTGGAKKFSMRTRFIEMFQRSLIKASQNTGAWITTGGTHTGIMKHVGKAVKKYAAVREDGAKVVTIGIATWGVIYESDKLINNSENETKPKNYDPDESMQDRYTILDKNHSHFILVDDGTLGDYANEIDLRTDLERDIANNINQGPEEVLIVCVIVQGGPGSLETVEKSIGKNIPVVAVKGSGGWADTLAEALQASSKDMKTIDEKLVEDLWKKYCRNFSDKAASAEDIKKWTEMVQKCVTSNNLLSVFDINPNDSSWDLHNAILRALLRANSKSNEPIVRQAHQQLELAMKWNCIDIAKDFILNDDSTQLGKAQIASLFFNALCNNKPDFCKLFLDHDVDLKEYCTVGELKKLYKSVTIKEDNQLYKKRQLVNWKDIGKMLREYLGPFYKSLSERDPYTAENLDVKVDDPYHEIFQWALVANYQEIAKHVWEYVSESMSAAIIATKILKAFASRETDYEKKKKFNSDAYEYERLAVGVLEKCFESDVKKTMHLVDDELPKWGGCTCMQVALMADAKFFVSRPGVESFLERVWMSKLDDRTSWFHNTDSGMSVEQSSDQETEKMNVNQICSTFFNAPVGKFWLNVVFYVVYLILFAIMIMSDFDLTTATAVSVYEIVLIVWNFTFICEEIREYCVLKAAHNSPFKLYINDPWNIMDFCSLLLFFVAFFVRLSQYAQVLHWSLGMYSLSFLIRCVRIVHIFAVHHILGPKILMVGKMVSYSFQFKFSNFISY